MLKCGAWKLASRFNFLNDILFGRGEYITSFKYCIIANTNVGSFIKTKEIIVDLDVPIFIKPLKDIVERFKIDEKVYKRILKIYEKKFNTDCENYLKDLRSRTTVVSKEGGAKVLGKHIISADASFDFVSKSVKYSEWCRIKDSIEEKVVW